MIAGDFNEWTNGMTTKLFKAKFQTVEAKPHLGKRKTYPGILPFLHLDHIYFDSDFKLKTLFCTAVARLCRVRSSADCRGIRF